MVSKALHAAINFFPCVIDTYFRNATRPLAKALLEGLTTNLGLSDPTSLFDCKTRMSRLVALIIVILSQG